jgi:hypothetical protein
LNRSQGEKARAKKLDPIGQGVIVELPKPFFDSRRHDTGRDSAKYRVHHCQSGEAYGHPGDTVRSHERLFLHFAETQRQMTELLVHQSERMDRFDRVHEELSRDIKRLLNMILDRLPPLIR